MPSGSLFLKSPPPETHMASFLTSFTFLILKSCYSCATYSEGPISDNTLPVTISTALFFFHSTDYNLTINAYKCIFLFIYESRGMVFFHIPGRK